MINRVSRTKYLARKYGRNKPLLGGIKRDKIDLFLEELSYKTDEFIYETRYISLTVLTVIIFFKFF